MNAKELLSEIKVYHNEYTIGHASKLIKIYDVIKSVKNDIQSFTTEKIEKFPLGKRTETKINWLGEKETRNICGGFEVSAEQFNIRTKNGEFSFVCPIECDLYRMFCLILGVKNDDKKHDVIETITFAPELINKLKKAEKYTNKKLVASNNDHISIVIENGFAEVCGTDFHKLYLSEKIECSGNDQQILINPKSFEKIRSLKEKDCKSIVKFTIYKENDLLFADFCGVTLELTEGTFAKYRSVIPEYSEKMVFSQSDIYSSVMQVKKYAPAYSEKIKFHLNGRIDISASDPDFETESVSVVYYQLKTFPDMDIAFNATLFLDCIKTFNSDNIEMYSGGDNKKCAIFKADNTKDLALLMPINFED